MKRFIGRLFGFDKRIAELEEKVRRLGYDHVFEVWTRSALFDRAESTPRDCPVGLMFLDFDHIHALNNRLGYVKVNALIRQTFKDAHLRKSDFVARWFSGDELVILTTPDGVECLKERLILSAETHGLSFTWAGGNWNPQYGGFEEQVEKLSHQVLKFKRQRDEDLNVAQATR